MKIGLQVYSIRDDANADFAAAMKKVKEFGYDGVELAGRYGLEAPAMRQILDDLGLEAISAHVQLDEMLSTPEDTFNFYKTVGCRFMAIPWMGEEGRPGGVKFEETLENIRRAGALAKEYGITLLYHNHDFEFVMLDGKRGLDVMYDSVSADLLQTELDTCWVNIGGENPAAYVVKYTGRAPVVHLKDFFKREGATADNMYELIGVAKKVEAAPTFEFRCVGHGMQDMPAILGAAEEAGAEWVIVEQDRPSQGLTPMECAYISRKYLTSVGY
ncbi:MAG: sugar phosphate isomerase/epimerase [Clostridia bacterium]|nr:sugar phosphate isomerase/epimerase [Clostridia bacterium]